MPRKSQPPTSFRASFLLAMAVGLAALMPAHQVHAQLASGQKGGLNPAQAGDMDPSGTMGDMTTHMAGHMQFTALHPVQPGDQARADAVVAAARAAMEPYKDYNKALADGYKIFLPNVKHQKMYHFTSYANARLAAFQFDPSRPTSLLYKKTPDGGYKLVGAMYTDRADASESDLDQRIPLSIARWHQHINFCKAPEGQEAGYFGKDAKFGLMGSITTADACDAAGGTFKPHLFGWMVHVYPYETDPKKIWAADADDAPDKGHDMDMGGMKMGSGH